MLAAQARSGLSLLAFARAEALCYATLRRWRRVYAGGITQVRNPCATRRRPATPGFIPVEVQDPPPSGDFTVSWPGGRSLRIPKGFDPDQLQRVLAVLEERS